MYNEKEIQAAIDLYQKIHSLRRVAVLDEISWAVSDLDDKVGRFPARLVAKSLNASDQKGIVPGTFPPRIKHVGVLNTVLDVLLDVRAVKPFARPVFAEPSGDGNLFEYNSRTHLVFLFGW